MKLKNTLATLLTCLIPISASSEVIDFRLTFSNIINKRLQSYVDNAQDGDTIRFVKYDQFDYPYGFTMDDEKNITLDLNNGGRIDGNITLMSFTEGTGLNIVNGRLYQNQVDVYGASDLTLNNVRFDRFGTAINWQSSGNLTMNDWEAQSYHMGTGTLVNVESLIGNSQIDISRGVLYQANEFVKVGDDSGSLNPTLNITHNTVNEVNNPLVFREQLTKVTGDIANNAFSELETLVTNPLYATRLRTISNNITEYDSVSKEETIEEPLMAMVMSSLEGEGLDPLVDNNYFFESGFAGQDWYDFNLTESSQLVDRGLDLGQTYDGGAPDIGRFESPYTATVPEPRGLGILGLGILGSLLYRKVTKDDLEVRK